MDIVIKDRNEKNMRVVLELVFIGSTLCTVFLNMEEMQMVGALTMYKIFDQTPSRQTDYEKVSESNVFPF